MVVEVGQCRLDVLSAVSEVLGICWNHSQILYRSEMAVVSV